MLVVDIIDGVPSISNVQEHFLRCSISGEFRPLSEFETNGVRDRTNCERTYHMLTEDARKLSAQTKAVMQSIQFKKLEQKLQHERAFRDSSISVKALIAQLHALPEDAHIVITQEGYYADGQLAEIHEPELRLKTEQAMYYSIGHSSQNY